MKTITTILLYIFAFLLGYVTQRIFFPVFIDHYETINTKIVEEKCTDVSTSTGSVIPPEQEKECLWVGYRDSPETLSKLVNCNSSLDKANQKIISLQNDIEAWKNNYYTCINK